MPDEVALLRERLDRLQSISGELTRAMDVDDLTKILMTVLDTPIHAPARGLWLHAPGSDELELVASSHMPPTAAERFTRIPIDSDAPGAVAHRELRTVISRSRAEAVAEFAELADVDRSTEGFVAVPLVLDDRSLGVLGLGYDETLPPEDVTFLEAVAGQVAQTLVRVRLAERDRRRREEMEFLAELTDTAIRSLNHIDLMQNVTSAAVPMLGDWCSLYFLPEDSTTPQIAVAHVDPEKVAWVKGLLDQYPFDPDSTTGVADVIRTGKTEHIPAVSTELIEEAIESSTIDPDEARSILDRFALTSIITVPLITKRRVVGAMQFISAESGRRYDEDDVALAEAVGGRMAEALDNAWLTDQHRYIAATLQRALLPPRLPSVPGVDIAARYWPAGVSEVGGDFYDLFQIEDDTWSIVIGDACGTGPNAAALTSIARHTVRAAARHGLDHLTVVDWLNQAIGLSDRGLFLTACYATLSRSDDGWTLRSVSAGHPLPIVVRRDGAAAVGKPGTLLGVFDRVRTTVSETALGPGDAVVFYTDGVTDLPPPFGLTPEQMVEHLAGFRELTTAGAIADAIQASVLERVPDPRRQDDIAVVVLRIADR